MSAPFKRFHAMMAILQAAALAGEPYTGAGYKSRGKGGRRSIYRRVSAGRGSLGKTYPFSSAKQDDRAYMQNYNKAMPNGHTIMQTAPSNDRGFRMRFSL